MKQIFNILKNKFKSNDDLNIKIANNRVVIKKNYFFKIFLWEASKQTVNISYNWNLGILGKIIFKKGFKKMNELISDTEKILIKENISIFKIVKSDPS